MIRQIWNVRSTREDPAQATLIQKSTNAETQSGFTSPGNSNSSSIKQQNLQEKPMEASKSLFSGITEATSTTLTENANNSEKDSSTDMNQKSGSEGINKSSTPNTKSLEEEEEKENLNEVNK